MFSPFLTWLKSPKRRPIYRAQVVPANRVRLSLEQLEDRLCPSGPGTRVAALVRVRGIPRIDEGGYLDELPQRKLFYTVYRHNRASVRDPSW